MNRVIVYIDGFNLYFGLKSKGWNRFYWLDLCKLSRSLLKQNQVLAKVKYFTSRVNFPIDKKERQSTYIDALETTSPLLIYYGRYQSNDVTCNKCGHIMLKPNEKMTDVNIAIQMLNDAYKDTFDTAILVSADSDLSGVVTIIRKAFTDKKVILAFPPDRFSFELSKLASGFFVIGRANFAKSVFPDTVIKRDGYALKIPEKWK